MGKPGKPTNPPVTASPGKAVEGGNRPSSQAAGGGPPEPKQNHWIKEHWEILIALTGLVFTVGVGWNKFESMGEAIKEIKGNIQLLETKDKQHDSDLSAVRALGGSTNLTRALQTVVALREANTRYLEGETIKLVDAMLLIAPSRRQNQQFEELKLIADRCRALYPTEEASTPAIYTICDALPFIVERKKLSTAAARESINRLKAIEPGGSSRSYALAKLLLAISDTEVSTENADMRNIVVALGHAEEALSKIPNSSAAWNLVTINRLMKAHKEWEGGARLRFVEDVGRYGGDLLRVWEFSETSIGQFKHHNNTAYFYAVALGMLADERPSHRVTVSELVAKLGKGKSLADVVVHMLELTEAQARLPFDMKGTRLNDAQVFTSLWLLHRSPRVVPKLKMEMIEAVHERLRYQPTMEYCEARMIRQYIAAINDDLAPFTKDEVRKDLQSDIFISHWSEEAKNQALQASR